MGKTRSLALSAMLIALALGLSYMERFLPLRPLIPLPGVKLGLANIVTLFALYFLGGKSAVQILVIRCALGAMFGGGLTAFFFSITGGVLAMATMALIRRFHEAKVQGLPCVTCWGDGSPLREFLYVDDLANLCVFLMNNYSGNETVNAGTGKELTIKALTELVAKVIGYTGEIRWDPSMPNGTPRKLLDVSKATALGWTYKTELEEGIRLAYKDFLENPMRAER